jgi:hypothetical protein
MSGESRADAEHCAARSKYATEFEFASHVIDARDRPLTTQPGCSHEAVQDAHVAEILSSAARHFHRFFVPLLLGPRSANPLMPSAGMVRAKSSQPGVWTVPSSWPRAGLVGAGLVG